MDVLTDYLGFKIPDVRATGYGLDSAAPFHALPCIAALKREVY